MTNYYINFDRELRLSANTKLINTIKDINEDDELIITMDSNDAAQARFITEILENNGMDFLPKGSHSGDKYRIIAYFKPNKKRS